MHLVGFMPRKHWAQEPDGRWRLKALELCHSLMLRHSPQASPSELGSHCSWHIWPYPPLWGICSVLWQMLCRTLQPGSDERSYRRSSLSSTLSWLLSPKASLKPKPMVQYIHFSVVVDGPELDTLVQMWPQKC